MISETTKLIIDTLNNWQPNNPEDYVVVLNGKTYEDLVKEQDHVIFSCPDDKKCFPSRLCGMDVYVEKRIPPEVCGYIMPREDYQRFKDQLDEIEENPLFFLDNNN